MNANKQQRKWDNVPQESKDYEAQLETIIRDHRRRMPLDL